MDNRIDRLLVLRAQDVPAAQGLIRIREQPSGASMQCQFSGLDMKDGEYSVFSLWPDRARKIGSFTADQKGRARLTLNGPMPEGVCVAFLKKGAVRFALAGFLKAYPNWSDPAYSQMRKAQREAEPPTAPPVILEEDKAQAKPEAVEKPPEIQAADITPGPDAADSALTQPSAGSLLAEPRAKSLPGAELETAQIERPESIQEIWIEYNATEADRLTGVPADGETQGAAAGQEGAPAGTPRRFDVFFQNIPTPAPDEKRIDYPVEFFPSYMQEDDAILWEEREDGEAIEPPVPEGYYAPYSPFRDDPPDDARLAAACFERLLIHNKEVYPFRLNNTRWVRVECPEALWGSHYLVGLVFDREMASYFAWGVPGVSARHAPPGLEAHRFISVRGNRSRGYWVLFVPLK